LRDRRRCEKQQSKKDRRNPGHRTPPLLFG
jgi:hypothetical protein